MENTLKFVAQLLGKKPAKIVKRPRRKIVKISVRRRKNHEFRQSVAGRKMLNNVILSWEKNRKICRSGIRKKCEVRQTFAGKHCEILLSKKKREIFRGKNRCLQGKKIISFASLSQEEIVKLEK